MSAILMQDRGLTISRYAGPEIGWSVKGDPESADRTRWQITNSGGMLVTLSAAEWRVLGEFFSFDCSPECEGPHLRCDSLCAHPGKESP